MSLASLPVLASLPMYDWPECREATDALWAGFAKHAGLSGRLDHETFFSDLWREPSLAFSQTCGYPFTHDFKGLLNYIATPHYAADGCDGPSYCSFVFARESKPLADFKGATPAINSHDSMSGMLALKLVFAPLAKGGEFFAPTVLSGGHRNSLRSVQAGKADLCAVDSVCVGLAKKYAPQDLEGLVEIARSPKVPGLPYVTRSGDPAKLRAALQKTFADPDLKSARDALLLKDVSNIGAGAYQKILDLESALPPITL